LLFTGCQTKNPTAPATSFLTSSPISEISTSTPLSITPERSTTVPLQPSSTPKVTNISATPPISSEITEALPYPPPVEDTPETSVEPYPPPGEEVLIPTSQGNEPYPPPSTEYNPYPINTQPAGSSATLTPTRNIVNSPTPTRTPAPPTEIIPPTPTHSLAQPSVTPIIGLSGQVTIWHSWGSVELQAFIQVIDAFQDINPDVRFDLTYVPLDELKARYESEAYRGRGPTILVGPSDWIAPLASQMLVEDLSSQLTNSLISRITSSAFYAGTYQAEQACLPYSMKGMLLYRNTLIIQSSAVSFNELVENAKSATRGGVVGAYLERGSYYSTAHLSGIGGVLLDVDGYPVFNINNYRLALDWVTLLREFEQAGATEFYGNRDLSAFKEGKIGYIIEGSWRMNELVEAIGEENLAIDPWPVYQTGHLSGYVQPDCLYLNANTPLSSEANSQASLQFMRYVLQKDIQSFLAEAGFIPAAKDAVVKNIFIQQAITAFQGGSPYPCLLVGSYGAAYWDVLDAALLEIFQAGVDPLQALISAYQSIQKRLQDLNPQ
jgi:maltose-binding protein MalE